MVPGLPRRGLSETAGSILPCLRLEEPRGVVPKIGGFIMDEQTERETHELVLAVIFQGRLLAQEWREVGLVPHGTNKPFVLGLLDSLDERKGLDDMDEERIELLGDQIRRFTNRYCEGLGDRALEQHVETEHIFDVKAINLINLACRWRQFRNVQRALKDKIAAIRETERVLAQA